jgi:hypothetical protein
MFEEEGPSFLKKRSKKLLLLPQAARWWFFMQAGHNWRIKVFCFFSSEKKSLPYFLDFAE